MIPPEIMPPKPDPSTLLPLSSIDDVHELERFLWSHNIGMTAGEARKVTAILGRDPTLVELFIFDIEWSEHCSYKSSRAVLKKYLPTYAGNVIQGPEEDAGIIHFTTVQGREWAIVVAHESHNHPSQVLPVEGAATGIGGIVRDVDCMGADVCAVGNGLRFGNPAGRNAPRSRWIITGVVDGIWQYGNALGVPNIAGDVYFDDSFDDNCLVNVVALGIVPADRIIRSMVPPEAALDDYDLILVGKPTDASGFGGVTFASEILNEAEEKKSIGAVQIHDPFLKNILITRKANRQVTETAFERGYTIGMKDLGGGGLACASSEICAAGGFGAVIDLDKVHTVFPDMAPEIIACSETQERFILAVPKAFTREVLRIYNEIWDLPRTANGARASVVGHTSRSPVYTLLHHGKCVCSAPIHDITSGIRYERPAHAIVLQKENPGTKPGNLNEVLLHLLGSLNIGSRHPIYRHYDTEVQGAAVIRPGEGDAGVIAPLHLSHGSKAAIALSIDGNPFVGEVNPYWGGAVAVAEAMRNVIAVGAVPRCLTDCLNYGNPENPKAFWQFEEGVKGIAAAARNLWQIGTAGEPVPIVSGNVSFYNESAVGRTVKPSPIIACVGTMENFEQAVTRLFKKPGNKIILVGERRNEMAGSAYFKYYFNKTGSRCLTVDWEQERADMHGVSEVLRKGLAVACHDIADGGLAVAVAEMCMYMHHPGAGIGADLSFDTRAVPEDVFLFSEAGGFILEVPEDGLHHVEAILRMHGAWFDVCGHVTDDERFIVWFGDRKVIDLDIRQGRRIWHDCLEDIMR